MSTAHQGSCLCGAVTLSATAMSNHVGACHCGMCRKWGGGPLLAVDCGSDVTFTGENNISRFASSEWAERGFCKQCGSHLFYRLIEKQQFIIPVGLFTSRSDLVFYHQIFIDKKPDFYTFDNATHNLSEAEVFAQYSPTEEWNSVE